MRAYPVSADEQCESEIPKASQADYSIGFPIHTFGTMIPTSANWWVSLFWDRQRIPELSREYKQKNQVWVSSPQSSLMGYLDNRRMQP